MVNDVSVSTTSDEIAGRGITPSDHPSSTFFSTFGGGIRFNLGYRLDSYAQYDFHSASRDIIDGNFIGDLLRSEEHTSELQSRGQLVCRLLLERTTKLCYKTKKNCTSI